MERPQAEAADGLQVRFSHRRSEDVQVSVETRPVLRQREERQLSRRHAGEHSPLHFPQWRRPHQHEVRTDAGSEQTHWLSLPWKTESNSIYCTYSLILLPGPLWRATQSTTPSSPNPHISPEFECIIADVVPGKITQTLIKGFFHQPLLSAAI